MTARPKKGSTFLVSGNALLRVSSRPSLFNDRKGGRGTAHDSIVSTEPLEIVASTYSLPGWALHRRSWGSILFFILFALIQFHLGFVRPLLRFVALGQFLSSVMGIGDVIDLCVIYLRLPSDEGSEMKMTYLMLRSSSDTWKLPFWMYHSTVYGDTKELAHLFSIDTKTCASYWCIFCLLIFKLEIDGGCTLTTVNFVHACICRLIPEWASVMSAENLLSLHFDC